MTDPGSARAGPRPGRRVMALVMAGLALGALIVAVAVGTAPWSSGQRALAVSAGGSVTPAPPLTTTGAAPVTTTGAAPVTTGVAKIGAAAHAGGGPAAGNAISPVTSAAPVPGLPTPTVNLPPVAPLTTLREVDAVVTLPATLTPGEVTALVHTPGVAAVEEVDTGTVALDGRPAATFGVDPGSFRAFTPQVTAAETKLWQYVAAGALASSYDMATDRALPLGTRLPLTGTGPRGRATTGWLGAFMSVGIPGVDLVVDNGYSSALGLRHDGGLVVSAPGMDPTALQVDLQSELPGASVEVTHSTAPGRLPGAGAATFVPDTTMAKVIAAALSRVGDAYVWGGNGPDVFDCSGLVGWAYARAGISMPRTAAQQALTGPTETLAQAQPGDLLFWHYDPSDPSFIDHVAIYLGGGKMVVAPHTGTDVQVTTVPLGDFAGAVRVEPSVAATVGGARFP